MLQVEEKRGENRKFTTPTNAEFITAGHWII
jgi:hypothetical protein